MNNIVNKKYNSHQSNIMYPQPPKITFPQSKNTNVSSLGNTLIEGIAVGSGSSIAKKSIDNIFNTNSSNSPNNKLKCASLFEELKTCLESENSICDTLFEEYSKKCLES